MNQVLVIFIIIIIGYSIKKIGYINRVVTKGITEIVLNVALPLLIITTFDKDLPKTAMKGALVVLAFAIIAHTATALAAKFIFKGSPQGIRQVMSFGLVFTNSAFMGIPVLNSIFGDVGIFYASAYSIVFNTFLWSYGQMLFTGVKDRRVVKQVLTYPGTISVFIGVILMFTPLKLPQVLAKTSEMVGALTTPLAMIVIGAMLSEVEFKKIFYGYRLYLATFLRLLVVPALSLTILKLMGIENDIAVACTLLVAMPVASNTVLFAEKFDGDSLLASRIVALSTALSIITIPIFAALKG